MGSKARFRDLRGKEEWERASLEETGKQFQLSDAGVVHSWISGAAHSWISGA